MTMKQLHLIVLALLATLLFVPRMAPAYQAPVVVDGQQATASAVVVKPLEPDPEFERAIAQSELRALTVMTDGTRETMVGFARVILDELTGRRRLKGQDPVFTVLSMAYEPERWYTSPIFPIEHPKVGEMLATEDRFVSAQFIIGNPGTDKLRAAVAEWSADEQKLRGMQEEVKAANQVLVLPDRNTAIASLVTPMVTRERLEQLVNDPKAMAEADGAVRALRAKIRAEKPFAEAASRLINRVSSLGHVRDRLLLAPDAENVRGDWVSPTTVAASTTPRPVREALLRFDTELLKAFRERNASAIQPAVERFLAVVSKEPMYPSDNRRDAKNFYYAISPFSTSAWVYLATAFTYSLFFFFGSAWLRRAATVMLIAGFALHTTAVCLRLYLTGHMPVSNMYESLTFTAWATMLFAVGFELYRRDGMTGLGATVVGFLALTASSLMPLHEVRMHPLRAVLNSYWLNIHVTAMLLSYGAFALAAFFAIGHLFKSFIGREALFGGTPVMNTAQMEEFAYRLVQVGWPILTLGITLGAVWADVAWGRYWGWDPKETWAFITWIVYTIYLHMRMVMGWRGCWSAAACAFGFLCVLITWFGVSYLPWFAGGLHTYASPT